MESPLCIAKDRHAPVYHAVLFRRARQRLHGVNGKFEIKPYTGDNPLYRHGPLRVAADRRHLEHADGTPFFWLADTWWMGLCDRLALARGVQALAADRREKGFNVVQIVAGLYPDMPAFDQRGRNEAGFPWETDYARIRPEYFDAADRRIGPGRLGFVPCIVGAWGYHLPWTGRRADEAALAHIWSPATARCRWCGASPAKATCPTTCRKTRNADKEFQRTGWTEVAALRARDRPVIIGRSRFTRRKTSRQTGR